MPEKKIVSRTEPSNGANPRLGPLMGIAGCGTALTDNYYAQAEIASGFHDYWSGQRYDRALFDRFFSNVEVDSRNLALPIEEYPRIEDFTDANNAFIRVGTDLGEAAIASALAQAGCSPRDIDAVFFTSVTGVAVPTIDARLINRLGFRPDVKRFPFFGLGCVAGAAGIARMSDYLKGWPEHRAILLSVELCSLTLQKGDYSIPAIVSAALFGDGAAAVVGVGRGLADDLSVGDGPRQPSVVATRSVFYPGTERVMGWDIGASGFQVVLSADVPTIVEQHLRADVDRFLRDHGVNVDDIGSWVCHPGGPRVIRAMTVAMGLEESALDLTRESLRTIGNLSSASVLFVLDETIRSRPCEPGTPGMIIAMGPGFCSELVLFEW